MVAGGQEFGCCATLSLLVVPQCAQFALLSCYGRRRWQRSLPSDNSRTSDELPFVEKELQQLVQRQTTATCNGSCECAVPSRAHLTTINAYFRRYPRAVDVLEAELHAVVCGSGS